ncbi:transcription elongation factor spt4 [Orbilia oligospora]|nr:transcription elongation factor spt4 [Orbilia oligospora]
MHAKPDPGRSQSVSGILRTEQRPLQTSTPSTSPFRGTDVFFPSNKPLNNKQNSILLFLNIGIYLSIKLATMSSANPDYKWRPVPTNHFRYLRACMVCAVVLTLDEFTRKGCPNCHPVLDYTTGSDLAQMCTSPIYEGCISIDKPTESWIAKWLRLDKYVPGVYATKVVGDLPEDAMDYLNAENIEYIPRDGSENNLE